MPLYKAEPTGAIVGTTDTQTLTNKTLTSPTLTTPALGVATATSINFGGSALGTYTSGSWTPDVVNSTSTSTWSTKTGFYIQIGGLVFAWFLCDVGNSGTGGTQITLTTTGLPAQAHPTGTAFVGGFAGSTSATGLDAMLGAGSPYGVYLASGSQLTAQQTYATGFLVYSTV